MPDFDTRRPDTRRLQEPDRPNRLRLIVDPSRQHLALRVLILVLLVVIPVVLLENEIQFETTPEYHLLSENDAFLPDEGGENLVAPQPLATWCSQRPLVRCNRQLSLLT